jgi:hypothetical protein
VRPLSKATSMTLKSPLGKYGWKGWSHKENDRPLDSTGTGDHLEEFSAVRAVMTNAPGVRMDVVWLPGVVRKFYPLTLERFANPAPWNLCHDYPLGKVLAQCTALFVPYQNYFRSVVGIRAYRPPALVHLSMYPFSNPIQRYLRDMVGAIAFE